MNKQFNVGIYTRLSVDDVNNNARKAALDSFDESMSIKNQKDFLSSYVQKMGWCEVKSYVDDGYSGSNFERPGFEEMMADVHNGTINLILVKDLSRFGRSYIEVGRYTDFILPMLNCRLVALEDNIDTGSDNNDMMHFRSLLNDQYLKDLSKKVKAAHKVMAQEGKRIGFPPYGYLADSMDKHKYLIDEYAAVIVKKIFAMRLQGLGYGKIAAELNSAGILSPREYRYDRQAKENPFEIRSVWMTRSVRAILSNEAYIGHRVQLKSAPMSYRIQKRVVKPEEEWVRAENKHPALISAEDWIPVQAMNRSAKETYSGTQKQDSLFQGLLKCSDCGSSLAGGRFPYKVISGETRYCIRYQCARYCMAGKAVCSNHSVNENVLKKIITENIVNLAKLIAVDKSKITAALRKMITKSQPPKTDKTLKQLKTDIADMERKITKLYEDKVMGVVSEQTFTMLIGEYEATQSAAKADHLQLLEAQVQTESVETDMVNWIALIEKHSAAPSIDRELLNDLIDRIEIGKLVKDKSKQTQEIKIFFKMVGYE